MHGTDLLLSEYEISASRLEDPKNLCESFEFKRIQKESMSSSASNNQVTLRRLSKTIFLSVTLLCFGLIRSFGGVTNILKICYSSQVAFAYIVPKLLMIKRGLTKSERNSQVESIIPPILEVLSVPLQLVIGLGDLNESELGTILNSDFITYFITPSRDFNSTVFQNSTRILKDNNSATIFESLAFSICEAYHQYKRYPNKIIVAGSKKISPCVLGQYRWALKIPNEIISFHSTNSSDSIPSGLCSCPVIENDPFDCNTPERAKIRSKFSSMCPGLAIYLMACNNLLTIKKALNYAPEWKTKSKNIVNFK